MSFIIHLLKPKGYNSPNGLSARQSEWNKYGKKAQRRIKNQPERELVSYYHHHNDEKKEPWYTAFMESAGKLENKTILEVGCGTGHLTVFMAEQGANLVGCDIAFEALKASHQRAKLNETDCCFIQLNLANSLPFANNIFDSVIGKGVLHHLSIPDVKLFLNEIHRILCKDGKAIFVEPVENSTIFDFIQNLFPRGKKGSPDYRPSILSFRLYRDYLEKAEDRALTTHELIESGQRFKNVRLQPFGLFIRIEGLLELVGIPLKSACSLFNKIDNFILRNFVPARRFCRKVVVEYIK